MKSPGAPFQAWTSPHVRSAKQIVPQFVALPWKHFRVPFACNATTSAAPAQLVRVQCAGPAVAAHNRSLRDLGLRNHAPTDPGQNGDRLLGAMDGPAANNRVAGQGASANNS